MTSLTCLLEVEEEVLEEEEEIEINSSRRIGTCTAETGGQVDTVTSVEEGEEITVSKTFSRTISREEGSSREVLRSTEREGGSSVTLEYSTNQARALGQDRAEPRNNDPDTEHREEANTVLSDSGVMVTEL